MTLHDSYRRDAARDRAPRDGLSGRLEDLYDLLSRGRRGLAGMAVASTLESTVVPIPIETVAAPLMISRPRRAWAVAAAMLVGSTLGALILYMIAFTFQDAVAPLVDWVAGPDAYAEVRARLGDQGLFIAVFLISVSFAPMQLAAIGAGALGGALPAFLAAVILSRGIRSFGLAALCVAFGQRATRVLGSRAATAASVAFGLLAIWIVAMILGA